MLHSTYPPCISILSIDESSDMDSGVTEPFSKWDSR
jgi:hypothetical protein